MKVNLKKAGMSDKPTLGNLLQFYMYDFSEFLALDFGDRGLYNEYILDDYFINPEKSAFVVLVDDRVAGFVLVSGDTILTRNQGGKCIKEFFVARRYRRKGVGRIVAGLTWDLYPGKWEMKVELRNQPAQKFWEAAIRDYPNKEGFRKEDCNTDRWKGIVFSFIAYRD